MNFLRNLMEDPDFSGIKSTDLKGIKDTINAVVSVIFGFLTLAAIILAIFLAYRFFTATDEGKRKNAKLQLIYAIIGVIALVVMAIVIPNIVEGLEQAAGIENKTTMFQLMF